ncbi:hypothetical protein, partial [Cupriavidus sp. 8B]
ETEVGSECALGAQEKRRAQHQGSLLRTGAGGVELHPRWSVGTEHGLLNSQLENAIDDVVALFESLNFQDFR